MKQLLIIRHAKSSWANAGMSDYERPLNERGEKDAPMMAARLLKRGIVVDAFVSSTALRAYTTATHFAKAYQLKQGSIEGKKMLYHAPPAVFYEVIQGLDNTHTTVAIFAHNPGITDFVNQLTNTQIDNMPTCGVFAVQIDIDNWKGFKGAEKEFWFFDYPKLA